MAPVLVASQRCVEDHRQLPPGPPRIHARKIHSRRPNMNRLVLLQIDADEITSVLNASAPREDGCFMILTSGQGIDGKRFMAVDPIFAPADGWDAQHSAQLRPSARWTSMAISRAVEARSGLLFIHY